MADYEKLGAFYLGRLHDPEQGRTGDQDLLYDAKDLTTHAVCVGMTGSGKTGLCVTLLEEAALDGIPAIAIDPKGDLGNLLLGFPELRAADFLPWVDAAEAARDGRTPEEHARWTADLWRRGLAKWGQSGERIARLREAADLAIYTPGGNAGIPLTVLRSFAAPPPQLSGDEDALRERTLSAVSGLLALVGVEADPIRSREHILLSALLDRAWRAGRDLDLAALIREIQRPPFERLGVLDLESFFSSKDRFELAMVLNNLLASPAFAAWSQGDPLDVGRLLYTEDGRPRLAILSIAHLSDAERMFFVTVLLNEVIAWMRAQPGSGSLRALLYMDEVFGYFPPTANPPSKIPMLTLLKQARAFGLGVVLATQNPVDLDYKGLSNAGTWFLGRLQTERDKARVIEGLEGASAAAAARFDRGRTEQILAGLGNRVFLMNNVHDDEAVVFETRWALSYLRGPLTRGQITRLMAERKRAAPPPAQTRTVPAVPAAPETAPAAESARPVVPPKIEEHFLPVARGSGGEGRLVYRPAALGVATLHYTRAGTEIDVWRSVALLAPLAGDEALRMPWEGAALLEAGAPDLDDEPAQPAEFASLPSAAARPASYTRWSKMLRTHLYRSCPLVVWRSADPRAISRPGESEGEFRAQLRQLLREKRDLELEKLRKRYAPKLARLQQRIEGAEQRVERERSQYRQQKLHTAVSIGATVLGALFGRKLASVGTVGRATTAARGASRAARERGDVARAQENVEALQLQLQELEAEFAERLEAVREKLDDSGLCCEELPIRPRKSDLTVERVVLVWTPWRVAGDGIAEPDF
jgi:DNA helicase HerA-like ATPase